MTRSGILYNIKTEEEYVPGERFIIELWTGEIDSKGKEIFDGDVFIRGKSDTKYWLRNSNGRWIGYSDEGDKYGAFTSGINHINEWNEKNNFITVIGNKWENI